MMVEEEIDLVADIPQKCPPLLLHGHLLHEHMLKCMPTPQLDGWKGFGISVYASMPMENDLLMELKWTLCNTAIHALLKKARDYFQINKRL